MMAKKISVLFMICILTFTVFEVNALNTRYIISNNESNYDNEETAISNYEIANEHQTEGVTTNKKVITPNGFGMGAILDDDSLDPQNERSLTMPSNNMELSSLASSVSNTLGLPPVSSQGSQGSCVGWAWGYYCLTHQVAKANGYWDTSIPGHQFSPAFIYNQINSGEDSGSYTHTDAPELIHEMGCATLSTMPYDENDHSTWPSQVAYEEALRYKITNTDYDYLYTDSDLDVLKAYLAAGNTAVLSITIYGAFNYDSMVNDIYTTNYATGDSLGGHAVCIIGYDDSKSTSDGQGAFQLVNSWGTDWGDNGFWWMSYEAIKDSRMSGRKFSYCDVIEQPYTPEISASVRISHDYRGQVIKEGIEIGVMNNGYINWWERFMDFDMAYYTDTGLYQNHPFPSTGMVFDLTDAAPYCYASEWDTEFYLRVSDSIWPLSGVIESFSITDETKNLSTISFETPTTIPDNSADVEIRATMDYPYINIDELPSFVGGEIELNGTSSGSSTAMICDVGFETGSTAGWTTWDDNPDSGNQFWSIDGHHYKTGGSSLYCGDTSTSLLYSESFSALIWFWPAGWSLYSAGTNSNPWGPIGSSMNYQIQCTTGGYSNVKEWAYYGPIDASSASELYISFWMDYEVQNAQSNQFASVLYSTDGSTFTYLKQWIPPIGETCSYVGEQTLPLPDDAVSSTLYFAFIFQGDYAGSMTVDDIQIIDVNSNYANDADSYVGLAVDLSDYESAYMSFDYLADLEEYYDWFSPVYHTTTGWNVLDQLGPTSWWTNSYYEIPTNADSIGFLFHSDTSITMSGVYIDNVQVVSACEISQEVSIKINETEMDVIYDGESWNCMWDTKVTPDGFYNISASTYFGTECISTSVGISVDNTAPIMEASTAFLQTGFNITIEGVVNSLGGSYLVSLFFSGGNVSQFFQSTVQVYTLNETTFYWLLGNSSVISDGDYGAELTIVDFVGNNDTIFITFSVDNTAPEISHPADIEYMEGNEGESINWLCDDFHPDYYQIFQDGTLIESGNWTDAILLSIGGYEVGQYNFTVLVWDEVGLCSSDTVYLNVIPNPEYTTTTQSETASTMPSSTNSQIPIQNPEMLLFVLAFIGGITSVIVILLIWNRKK